MTDASLATPKTVADPQVSAQPALTQFNVMVCANELVASNKRLRNGWLVRTARRMLLSNWVYHQTCLFPCAHGILILMSSS